MPSSRDALHSPKFKIILKFPTHRIESTLLPKLKCNPPYYGLACAAQYIQQRRTYRINRIE